jgi:hypothetical protein
MESTPIMSPFTPGKRKSKMRWGSLSLIGAAVVGYDTLLRPWLQDWGATSDERIQGLPGDDIVEEVMSHHTRAVTIDAPPEAVWPWLVQMGDRRAGFYSYDWIERFLFPGTVHYVAGKHSATRIHSELQDVHVGDRINTGSIGNFALGSPITVLEPSQAFAMGTWAFVLRPLSDERTRLLVGERDTGWLRMAAPKRVRRPTRDRVINRLRPGRTPSLRHGPQDDAGNQGARRSACRSA